ncbi:MAG: ABC transporter permease [Cellulosilyticum sp.]|nr:ABC transporter permease [Cellulosilyticum sp.]
MNITAKLAWNQIKRNRYRTIGAILAILLSTALTTAVFCFVTSANTMLVSFLGERYGEYGGAYQSLLLIPAVFFAGLIFVMSVTVISNVFQASANQRMNEFGILKCVGSTTKQIKETVIFESIWLSILGIPLGMVSGLGAAFFGVKVTGNFVAQMNELQQSIIMRPITMELSFSIKPWALIVSALFSFFTVLYAAYKPAKKAGNITALSCIRGLEDSNVAIVVHTKKWVKRCFGFEGILAERNMTRNKASFQPTIRALAIGILLLLCTGSLVLQAQQLKAYMDPGTDDVMMDYCSNRTYEVNEETGRTEEIISKPIYSQEAELVRQRLLEYGDIEITGVGGDNGTYHVNMEMQYLTPEMQQAMEQLTEDSVELKVDILVLDQTSYEKICEEAKVPIGSNILLNYYRYNDNGRLKHIVPFSEELTELVLQKADSDMTTVSVDAFLMENQVPTHVFALNESPIRLVLPEAELRFYDWYCNPEDELAYMQYAKSVGEEFFPTFTNDSYAKEGFTVRVSRVDTMIRVLNIAIVMVEIIVYGFVGVLLLIGLVSVISTLSTNVMIRAREFAILKSVGMPTEGLQKMLLSESVICTLKATVWGVPLGILIPYLINLVIRQAQPVLYQVPWGLLLTSIVGIFLIILAVTFGAVYKLRKQNLIESIRLKNY